MESGYDPDRSRLIQSDESFFLNIRAWIKAAIYLFIFISLIDWLVMKGFNLKSNWIPIFGCNIIWSSIEWYVSRLLSTDLVLILTRPTAMAEPRRPESVLIWAGGSLKKKMVDEQIDE